MAARPAAERLFLVGTILLLGWLTFLIFRPFFDWILLGFLAAYLFYAPYRALLRVVPRRGVASGIMLVLVLGLIFLPLVLLALLLFQDVRGFAQTIQELDYQAMTRDFLGGVAALLGLDADPKALDDLAATFATQLRESAGGFLRSFAANLLPVVTKVFIGLFVFGFTVFYGFVDGPRIVDAVLSVIPLHRPEKRLLLAEVRNVTNAVFVGHVLVALIQAAVGTLGFFLLGVPRTFLWGFVMLIASLIPVVGPFVVWVPVGLYLFFTSGPVDGVFSESRTFAALGVLLVVGPIVSTIDNLVRPKLVGSRADVHPFLILVGALGGLFVFGITGFVLGPLVLSLFVAILRVYRLHWRGQEQHGPGPGGASGRGRKKAGARSAA